MKQQELKDKLNNLWNRLDYERDDLEKHVDAINDTIKEIAKIVDDIVDLEDEDIEVDYVVVEKEKDE